MPHDLTSWLILAAVAFVAGFFWAAGAYVFGKVAAR